MIISRSPDPGPDPVPAMTMEGVEGFATRMAWGRIPPGCESPPDHHDEVEVFVFMEGTGELADGFRRYPVSAGSVVCLQPFDRHAIVNTGSVDIVFATFYWREPVRAARSAASASPANPAVPAGTTRPVFVFSTPPTPNGDLHLGHLSGPYLGADVYTRFQRMIGVQVWHVTGSDDHQSYVVAAARSQGRTPAEVANGNSAEIRRTLELMDIDVDGFIETSQDEGYRDGVRDFFSRVLRSGEVGLTESLGLADPGDGRYLYEADVRGGCPGCAAETAGNICEECGEPNSCADLDGPVVNVTDRRAASAPVKRYSLPLHRFGDDVRRHQSRGRVPARLRELAERVLSRPSVDIALTHPSQWGVRPADGEVDGQVVWVWAEMAYGFLHGIEDLGRRTGADWSASAPQPDWKIVHFFGYDNTFYHTMLFPALYRCAFPDWDPDIDYHFNEFYLLEGEKFSTSQGHAIWGKEILGPDSVDAVRYYLACSRPERRRTEFTREGFAELTGSRLVGEWQEWLHGLGRRVERDYEGFAPDGGRWTPEHTAFLDRLDARRRATASALAGGGFSLNRVAEELHGIVTDTRAFSAAEHATSSSAAWSSEARTAVALELAAASLLARCAAPLMPRFAERLSQALGFAPPGEWPEAPELLAPGQSVALHRRDYFRPPE